MTWDAREQKTGETVARRMEQRMMRLAEVEEELQERQKAVAEVAPRVNWWYDSKQCGRLGRQLKAGLRKGVAEVLAVQGQPGVEVVPVK